VNLSRLPPFDEDDGELIRVVIEKPKGGRNKLCFRSGIDCLRTEKGLACRNGLSLMISASFLRRKAATAIRSMR
jgi:hypothetical protein